MQLDLQIAGSWHSCAGGLDHILLEVIFPVRYPIDPPFIRVVYPRFMFHTGHVTWGGSVCLETLVNTGSPTGYSPSYTVETLLCMLLFNLTSDTEGTAIRQGRIDFIREREFDRLDYSLEEGDVIIAFGLLHNPYRNNRMFTFQVNESIFHS